MGTVAVQRSLVLDLGQRLVVEHDGPAKVAIGKLGIALVVLHARLERVSSCKHRHRSEGALQSGQGALPLSLPLSLSLSLHLYLSLPPSLPTLPLTSSEARLTTLARFCSFCRTSVPIEEPSSAPATEAEEVEL